MRDGGVYGRKVCFEKAIGGKAREDAIS